MFFSEYGILGNFFFLLALKGVAALSYSLQFLMRSLVKFFFLFLGFICVFIYLFINASERLSDFIFIVGFQQFDYEIH